MNAEIPDLILSFEKKEKERLQRRRKKKNSNWKNGTSYSFVYFLFLHNKNGVVEISTTNFDTLQGEITELKKHSSNNKLKGIFLTNVVKKSQSIGIFEKVYIPLSQINTCMPVDVSPGKPIKEKSISRTIINGYKNLMVNEIYDRFKKLGG
ncbi:conserved Plasmodium protein, unknown function [Plasmodium ovale wallikeri]|uniref:Uncharacterized protein n=2 Tax=Plasmodium ovale TaxID=36330 RepID=A0A1A8YWV5_PLAOA|nr:conserved Plasmodium protein, unknown function [Plasmodium ovale wallikeri]SBT36083.1 conserved Plasmodium protein, unknown function [Plasmodium ovale wallikeri]SBT77239.1 conserved Plasmodium protein, unknown function [Plasmodium ovale]